MSQIQDEREIHLVLVVPCYNEEQMLHIIGCAPPEAGCDAPDAGPLRRKTNLFIQEVDRCSFKRPVAVSFVFVDDGSSDNTLSCLRELAYANDDVHYVSLSRNFGKEGALYAGLEKALELGADYVATMDVDLQDPPSLLPQMLDIAMGGEYDTVATRRVTRKGEPKIRSFFARRFYKLINRISDTEIVDGALEYENVERAAGETKWSFWKLFRYSIDGIVSFSTLPLSIASVMGVITCVAAFAYLAFIIVKTVLYGEPVAGYPSLMCVILFLGGVQLISIGIVGQYLAKAYLETKRRPIYVVREEM